MNKSVGRLVSILYRKNQIYLNVVLKPLNISASELPFLIYLLDNNGVSQEELASYLIIDKASTARAIQSLMEKGFLRKEKDMTDKRANKVFVTEIALEQKSKIKELLQQWNDYLTKDIEQESVDTMFAALEAMVDKVHDADYRETWGNE